MATVIVGLALLAFWLYCLFDVISTPAELVRRLPKPVWIVVAIIPGLGGLMWLAGGRPVTVRAQIPDFAPEPVVRVWHPRGPDDDPEFLQSLDRRLREREEDR